MELYHLRTFPFTCTCSYLQNSINYKSIEETEVLGKTRHSYSKAGWAAHSRREANCNFYPLESHLIFLVFIVKVDAFWLVQWNVVLRGREEDWCFTGFRSQPFGKFKSVGRSGVLPIVRFLSGPWRLGSCKVGFNTSWVAILVSHH